MKVDAIRLRNFRGFVDQTLELGSLTVLLGPNSSGKSSFGHSLAALAHAHVNSGQAQEWLRLRPHATDDPKWPVDLGPLEALRTAGRTGSVYIGLRTERGWVELGFGAIAGGGDLSLCSYEYPGLAQAVATAPEQHARSDGGAETTPAVLTSATPAPPTTPRSEPPASIERRTPWDWYNGTAVDAGVAKPTFQGARLLTLGAQSMTSSPGAPALVDEFLRGLAYMGPVRSGPRRVYAAVEPPVVASRVGYRGEHVPARLALADQQVRLVELPALPTDLDSAVGVLRGAQVVRNQSATLLEAVRFWMGRLTLTRTVEADEFREDGIQRFKLDAGVPGDSRTRPLTDLGFGLSQVLPVLVGGLVLGEGELFVVDLPEAHLHPAPQAELGDFFCALVKSGRNVLVETHSERLFHRLRLRAALDPELQSAIRVYFLDSPREDGLCPAPIPVGIPEGPWAWPRGFMKEGWNEEMALQLVLEAKTKAGA